MIDDGAKPGRATEAAVVTALPISAPAGDASTEPFASGWLGDTMELGARMGRYHLRSLVGTGGLGVVFEAWDPELDRRVAVKILRGRSEAAGGPGESRLRREGQVMARLTHPNVIRVYDVGVENGHAFVAMEFVAGGTLADWLIKRPRAPGEILAAFAQAGRGLAAAHGAGLVHRDFKPSNVLVGDDGRVLVTDFGLARVVSGEAGETPSGDAAAPHRPLAVTRTGQLVGTPAYMAPEQLVGGPIDARADQYSFCVALWRALFGTAPHEGESFDEIAAARTAGALSSPRPAAAAAIPARVREALERGLSPTPDARFASMDELLEVLAVRDARARARLVGAAVGVAAAVGAALWIGARLAGGPPAEDPCASRVDRFAGLWDLEARSAVRAAFIATGRRYAEASFGELARQLDGRRRAWERMRRDSCEATRVRREQSDRMLDMRAACLDRRLADLSAFVAELRTADAETVGRAAQEASSIGDPAGCADVDALARRAPLPGDPGKRAAVAAVERELSAVRGQLAAGRAKDAVPRAEAAVGRARETGHAPVLAQALALAGDIGGRALSRGDPGR